MKKESDFPFIYINHGKPLDIYSFQGEKYIIFSFKEKVNETTAKKIEKLTPKVLRGTYLWSDKIMMNYSLSEEDDIIMHYMQKRKQNFDDDMDNELFMELFTDLAIDIEKWAMEANKIAPIDFFIGLDRIQGSDWDKYSDSQLENVIGKLEAEAKELNPRKKQIINETLQQLLQGKFSKLKNGSKKKIKDLIAATE